MDEEVFLPPTPPLRFKAPRKRTREETIQKRQFMRLLKRAALEAREAVEDLQVDNPDKAAVKQYLKFLLDPSDVFDTVVDDSYYSMDDELSAKTILEILQRK